MKLKILSWSKSKIAACFFMFFSRKFKFLGISLYHAIQKGNQGAGQNRAHISAYCLKRTLYIKVCTTRYTPIRARFCPAPWFPVCTARYREKQQDMLIFWIYFITGSEIHNRIYKFDPVCVLIFLSLAAINLLQNRIYKFDPVCVLIFLSLGCSVVMVLWLEQN